MLVNRPSIGEVGGLVDGRAYHASFPSDARTVSWDEPHLYITRLRLLSDRGFPAWDVSYCHGVLRHTQEVVRVELPFSQLPKRGYRRAIVAYAKADGLYAHGIGALENISTLC